MRKAAEVKKEVNKIRKDIQKEIFLTHYQYVEGIMNSEKSIGELVATGLVEWNLKARDLRDKINEIEEKYQKFLHLEEGICSEMFHEFIEEYEDECFDTIREELKNDGWEVIHDDSHAIGLYDIKPL